VCLLGSQARAIGPLRVNVGERYKPLIKPTMTSVRALALASWRYLPPAGWEYGNGGCGMGRRGWMDTVGHDRRLFFVVLTASLIPNRNGRGGVRRRAQRRGQGCCCSHTYHVRCVAWASDISPPAPPRNQKYNMHRPTVTVAASQPTKNPNHER
jgi:hypothetical protein